MVSEVCHELPSGWGILDYTQWSDITGFFRLIQYRSGGGDTPSQPKFRCFQTFERRDS